MMLRTQVYLPKNLHQELTTWAKQMDVPMAEVVRKILKAGLVRKESFLDEENDLLELSKLKLKGGPKDLSAKLDFYIYQ